MISMPVPEKLPIASPLIVTAVELSVSPFAPAPADVPSSTITGFPL